MKIHERRQRLHQIEHAPPARRTTARRLYAAAIPMGYAECGANQRAA